MDEQGIEAMWLFPTLGVLYEELIKEDTEAVKVLFHGFNRWLHEDWGVNYQNRIFGAPYISLADVDFAVRELEWALKEGARVVCMRPSAVHTREGTFSPSHQRHDPFWARVSESGIAVVIHAGDSGYTTHGYVSDGFTSDGLGAAMAPNIKHFNIERAAYDFLITCAFEKLFERHPGVRIASVENGAEFLPDLFRKLDQSANRLSIAKFEEGETVFEQGDQGDVFYLITTGAARVLRIPDYVPNAVIQPDPIEIAVLHAGDYFGERALLTDEPRVATIAAVGALFVCYITRDEFEAILGAPLSEYLEAKELPGAQPASVPPPATTPAKTPAAAPTRAAK